MSNAAKYQPHYTAEDYGHWEGDWELWNGVPVSMSPAATPKHQRIASQLISAIHHQLNSGSCCDGCVVLGETDWKVSFDTVVRPDVLVTCEPLPEKHIISPPVLIAEILSPPTANKDRTAKRALYEANGVAFYAMIDPDTQSVEILELADGTFVERNTKNGPVDVKLTNTCSIQIKLDDLFRRRVTTQERTFNSKSNV